MKKNRLTRFLITSVVCGSIVALNYSPVFATNNDWSAQAISDFLSNKIEAPTVLEDEKYRHDITREEFAQLIVGLYLKAANVDKKDIQLKENPFTDTTNVDVQRAYSLGIIKGTSKNTFNPQNKITREQFAVMITRFLNIQNINTNSTNKLNGFVDKNDISPWAFDSFSYCVDNQIVQGAQNQLQPKESTTVEQAITMLDRVAIENNWIIKSNYIYVRGFSLPNDTEISYKPDGTYDFILKIDWNNISDTEKLKNDLNYMLSEKFKENYNSQKNKIIEDVMKTNQEEFFVSDITIGLYELWIIGEGKSTAIKFNEVSSRNEVIPIL